MSSSDQSFLDSLDLQDAAIEPYIPFILQDLWELGSMPEYIIQLAQKHIGPNNLNRVVDFGCGKGAVLIQMWQKMPFQGVGIDLVPAFIHSAQKYAKLWNCVDSLTFEIADIRKRIIAIREMDLVIFGQDSDVLGNVAQSLNQLKNCIANDGWIMMEVACRNDAHGQNKELPDEEELWKQIHESGLVLIDRMDWEREKLIDINHKNTHLIKGRIESLIQRYPNQEELFRSYLEDQIEECRELAEEIQCMSLILQK